MTTAVKICGLTTPAALDAAVAAGADYVGLVFFPRSPRHVDVATAAALAARARGRSRVVALMVDPTDDALSTIVAEVAPDWLQLHGHEPVGRVAEVRARFGLPVLKAVPVATAADVAAAEAHRAVADLLLFDAKPPPGAVLTGGNGLAFDWRLVADVARRYPFMLAGGLTVDTVATAIATTGAAAVDVSSGVESAPGVKDVDLITRFVAAVRESARPVIVGHDP
jgi:phosphoribosylanthranilate isomerase